MADSACAPDYNPTRDLSNHFLQPPSNHTQDPHRLASSRYPSAFRSSNAPQGSSSHTDAAFASFAGGGGRSAPRSQVEACPPNYTSHLYHTSSAQIDAAAFASWSGSSAASDASADDDAEYSTAWSPELETSRTVSPASSWSYRSSSMSRYAATPGFGASPASGSGSGSGYVTPTLEEVEEVLWASSDADGRLSLDGSQRSRSVAEARGRTWVGEFGTGKGTESRTSSASPHPITLNPNNDAEWDFDRLFSQARFSPRVGAHEHDGHRGRLRTSISRTGSARGVSRLREVVSVDEVGSAAIQDADLSTAVSESKRSAAVYEALKETARRRLAAVQLHFGGGHAKDA